MKFKILLISLLFGLNSLAALAGGSHSHGHVHSHEKINQVTAKAKALDVVLSLIKNKKLDKSWKSIKANSAEKKVFKGQPEWVVIFTNKKITDVKKQKLYVFLTLTGEYVAANHSGN